METFDVLLHVDERLEVTDVFDLTLVSGAAAIGAMLQQVKYYGICLNDAHRLWLDSKLEHTFFALVVDGKTKVDEGFVRKVHQYCHRAVDAARRWLPSEEARAAAAAGNNDSDMEV